MSKVKLVVIAVVAVLALIVILQNTAAVETKLLFVTITMPRAALLLGTFVVGFLIGLLTAGWLRRKRK